MSMRGVDQLFRDFDRLTRATTGPVGRSQLPIDVVRRDDAVVVAVDVPGIDPDHIEVTVENETLTISAERHRELGEEERLVAAERPTGAVARQLHLGRELDGDRITADYRHGVLEITVPVAEAAQPRRISVSGRDAITSGG